MEMEEEVPVSVSDFYTPSPPPPEDLVIDIQSVGEIVSSIHEAKKIVSPAQVARLNAEKYGDLPEEIQAGRFQQECQWMAPAPDDTIHDMTSHGLLTPHQCIIIGTNGVVSFALQCANEEEEEKKSKEEEEKQKEESKKAVTIDEKTKLWEKQLDTYGKRNAAFAYKLALLQTEREAMLEYGRYQIGALRTKKEALDMLKDNNNISEYDNLLRLPFQKLGPLLTEKINTLTDKPKQTSTRSMPRPGGKYGAINHSTVGEAEEKVEDETTEESTSTPPPTFTVFRLLVCKTPTILASQVLKEVGGDFKKANKKYNKKRPKWTDVGFDITTAHRTVPAAAFNDTHLVILYQPHRGGLMYLDVYAIGNWTARIDRFRLRFPPQFVLKKQGLVNVHLSALGICSITFGNGALVFDIFREVPNIHVLTIESENMIKHLRRVTCGPVFHPRGFVRSGKDAPEDLRWTGTILMGSDKGEVYAVSWATGELNAVDHSPAVEPVLGVHYSNGKLMMQTAMSICGRVRGNESYAETTILDVHRPVAFDTCGGLIFIMSKYSFIKILSSLAGRVAREIPAPEGTASNKTPALQFAYPGLRAYPDRVVCVYPNGVVRCVRLAKVEPGAEQPKE